MKLRGHVARIETRTAKGGTTRGTGTLIGDELLLTAVHVVAQREPSVVFHPGPIQVFFGSDTTGVPATVIDGLWDGGLDWVLLDCPGAPALAPLPLAEVAPTESTIACEAFGFPDAKPDGMLFTGHVADPGASYQGAKAMQLFLDQAAAGDGAPVNGLSGGPLFVEGALVGLIRSSLKKRIEVGDRLQDVALAGTLFACPLGVVLDAAAPKLGKRLRLPDPCRGLPGLPKGDLPPDPFFGLKPYSEADAELFFGRNADIRALYEELLAEDSAPILLFFGQSGAGKSSLLDAGLRPRLSFTHEIRYRRRDASAGLRADFLAAVDGDWLALEARMGRPVIVVLDQVEEAFTSPRGSADKELEELATALGQALAAGARRPRGKLVLSFRKEWLPEIRAAIAAARLPFSEHFLPRLKRAGVMEVVRGLERTERLRRKYKTSIETDLEVLIAGDLTGDEESPVAPTLQLLMTRLYAGVKDTPGARSLTSAGYKAIQDQGIVLMAFLDLAIKALPEALARQSVAGPSQPEATPNAAPAAQPEATLDAAPAAQVEPAPGAIIESLPLTRAEAQALTKRVADGLADDLLEAHVTPHDTAATVAQGDLATRYPRLPKGQLVALLGALESRYLLTHPGQTGAPDKQHTRLSHDTLGPLVRARLRASMAPGQRARRLVERLAPEWEGDKTGRRLDSTDLRIVLSGLQAMRAPTEAEARLIASSERWRRLSRIAVVTGLFAVAMAGVLLAGLYLQNRDNKEQRVALEAQTKARAAQSEARDAFDKAQAALDPVGALLWACRAVEVAPDGDPMLPLYVTRAEHLFTEGPYFTTPASATAVQSAALDAGWTRLAIFDAAGAGKVITLDASNAGRGVTQREVPIPLEASPQAQGFFFSPDGRWLATLSYPGPTGRGSVQLWAAEDGSKALDLSTSACAPTTFSPDSKNLLCCGLGGGADWGGPAPKDDEHSFPLAILSDDARWKSDPDGASRLVAGCPNPEPPAHREIPNLSWLTSSPDQRAIAGLTPSGWLRAFRIWPVPEKEAPCADVPPAEPEAAADFVFREGLDFPVGTPDEVSFFAEVTAGAELVVTRGPTMLSVYRADGALDWRSPVWPDPAGKARVARMDAPFDVSQDGSRAVVALDTRDAKDTKSARDARFRTLVLIDRQEHVPRTTTVTGRVWDVAMARDGRAVVTVEQNSPSTDDIVVAWDGKSPPQPLGDGRSFPSLYSTRLTRSGPFLLDKDATTLRLTDVQSGSAAGDLAQLQFENVLGADLAEWILRRANPIRKTASTSMLTLSASLDAPLRISGVPGSAAIAPMPTEGAGSAAPYVLPRDNGTDEELLAFSPKGPWIATQGPRTGRSSSRRPWRFLYVYSILNGQPIATIPQPHPIVAAAFTPDGNTLVTIDALHVIRRWFIRQPNEGRPDWVKDLAPFVSGTRMANGGAVVSEPGWLVGPKRDDFMARLRASASAGNRGAAHALRHIEGK